MTLGEILLSVTTGVISGITANWLYTRNLRYAKLRKLKRLISIYEGSYDVYHLRDLANPDQCDYKINIALDEPNGSLKIIQTGNNNYDKFIASIQVNGITYDYGEGNYVHPHKEKLAWGRIKIFLINSTTINVDKEYIDLIDESTYLPRFEKWQWRRNGKV